ncbi:hypothetical protein RvY_01072 [Ramazzottius varieornatus]|uniref:Uncharacterized protein n=1 Tax=Ramazzottius varieornatus TaxID=947166 RepID=A0A1D1UFY3_RAMVA|nr:hypothetical protein RvY_01072 [Ramazzottius varieornatus]
MFNPTMAHEIDDEEKHQAASKIQAKFREYKARKETKEALAKKHDVEPTAMTPGQSNSHDVNANPGSSANATSASRSK